MVYFLSYAEESIMEIPNIEENIIECTDKKN